MSDFQAIADRVEIEALRGEFTDAAMMRDRARLASLFTPDGALRMPNIPAELVGRDQIRAGGERLQAQWEFFVQTTHPGTIQLDGDTATGRAYIQELARARDGRQGLNYAIYHDRYQRTGDGWKFTERVYEVRYLDTTPLAGSAPVPSRDARHPPAGNVLRRNGAPRHTTTSPGGTMTTPIPATLFADPAPAQRLERAAAALTAHGFTVEILDDAAAARTRIKDLIPEGASVFTGASETLRLSGIDEDINNSGRYEAIRPRGLAMDRATRTGRDPAAARQPRRHRGQRRRAHRNRLPRGRLGQRKPATRLRRRRRPRDLDRRGAEGGTRPEHRAAPRRRPLPPAGKRPRPGGLRVAQRHQPPSHPQRRTPPRARHRPAAPRSHRILNPQESRPRGRTAGGC